MATCRCHMCGRKSAGKNNVRNDYIRAGARFDDFALSSPEHRKFTKKQSHRALRRYNKKLCNI